MSKVSEFLRIQTLPKYAHFFTDMSNDYRCSVTAFEISSLGYISTRNHSSLYTLHKYVKPGVKLATFKKNISSLSLYSSYYIFITRQEPVFCQPPFLQPTFKDQWTIYKDMKNMNNINTVVKTSCERPAWGQHWKVIAPYLDNLSTHLLCLFSSICIEK